MILKILLVHNFYGSSSPSGENKVFEIEKKMLLSRGHQVECFTYHSDTIRNQGIKGLIIGAFTTPWNFKSAKRISNVIDNFQPDLVHVHNTFPLISPSVFHAIGNRAAKVLTLHNYRLFCPAAIPMRNGNICTECLDKRSVLPALRYGCYRNNHLATIPLSLKVWLHRFLNTWKNHVDGFIALTEFQKKTMVEAGLPSEKVHVKPNFYKEKPTIIEWKDRDNAVVFAGRLSQEKGVITLVKAWIKWGGNAPELRIVGDGPLKETLQKMISVEPECNVRFLGQVQSHEAEKHISRAKLVVLPSECFEGFPMVIREAFAFGTPVAVSNIGPLPSIVQDGENGVKFQPRNSLSLLRTVQRIWNSPDELELLGEGARRSFLTKYTEEANYKMLMHIYNIALNQQNKK